MPNLSPPIKTVEQALVYRTRILAQLPAHLSFEPLMTLYLTEDTSVEEIEKAVNCPFVYAVKWYPAGATTNSAQGVQDSRKITHVLTAMADLGLPLLIHGEVTESTIDIFDREKLFIQDHLIPLTQSHPHLKIVLEHITTQEAVEFVQGSGDNIAATLTPQHLHFNRNQLLVGGIKPHFYCLPVLKRETHRQALLKAAFSGSPKFFLGTDSAPHQQDQKETACGCAGIYSAHAAIELYAEIFDQHNQLDKLAGFASEYGAAFYGLTPHQHTITLKKQSWQIPESYPFKQTTIIPMMAGETLSWQRCDA